MVGSATSVGIMCTSNNTYVDGTENGILYYMVYEYIFGTELITITEEWDGYFSNPFCV